MDEKIESLLKAVTKEEKVRSDLEVQVSQTKQRLVCHNKYLDSISNEMVKQMGGKCR